MDKLSMKNEKQYNKKNGLLTLPLVKASVIPLSHIVEILNKISTDFTLITGNEGYLYYKEDPRFTVCCINYKIDNSIWKIARYAQGQIKAAILVIKFSKTVDNWFFFGGQRSVIPIITAKILNKNAIIIMTGSAIRDSSFPNNEFLPFVKILSEICLFFADKLIVYSPNLIQEWHLEPHHHKILIAHEHFLDFTTFTVITPFSDRPHFIGYIGRLSDEKGVQHFVQTLPVILEKQKDLRVLIGGDGQLEESIRSFIKKEKIQERIDLPSWISHDDLPKYLNQLRLIVIPSYTEGLPNTMLEAMACGTPVLATPVGAIPEVIRDSETGFIMENNSPDCIGRNVLRVLNSPDLEEVAERGRKSVETEFTFEKTVDRWIEILRDVGCTSKRKCRKIA